MNDQQYAINEKEKNSEMNNLSHMMSGYELTAENWQEFLLCWDRGKSTNSLLSFGIEKNRRLAESSLLSKSISDFYTAYSGLGGKYLDPKNMEGIGMFSSEDILPLSEYSSEILSIAKEWEIESSDQEYFIYGIDQDDSSGRYSVFKDSLVIGKHGASEYELILLYLNSKTLDGEFEVALLSHAYEFRTPSFAEMMRQLSVLEVEGQERLPPYSQEFLEGTCANLLPLSNVWWK